MQGRLRLYSYQYLSDVLDNLVYSVLGQSAVAFKPRGDFYCTKHRTLHLKLEKLRADD